MRNHLKHFLLLAVLTICFTATAVAQGTVKGKVVDAENNEPLIGATVSVSGTTLGTVTDIDGNFVLKLTSSKATLEFKYLGYQDKTMKVTQKGNVDLGTIALSLDAKTLGDVVITSSIAVARKTPVAVTTLAPEFIEEKLREGKNVSFLTIGDPYVYSTYIHMLKHMEERGFHVETVPGITSFCAAASLVDRTLVVGDNPLMILPATRVKDIKDEKYVVIMKVYKNEETVVDFLEEKGFDYVYVSRAGREGQLILTDKEEIKNARDYMALILASRE